MSAPSMMAASSAAPILLVFGTMISTAPVSSRMPVTYRNHCPKPTAVKSATISGVPISFTLTNTSARNDREATKAVCNLEPARRSCRLTCECEYERWICPLFRRDGASG